MQAVKARHFSVCIDHKNGTLHFSNGGIESSRVHMQLTKLSERLGAVLKVIAPTKTAATADQEEKGKEAFFKKVIKMAGDQHPENLKRKEIIEEKKWLREREAMIKERNEKKKLEEDEKKRKTASGALFK